MKTANVGVTFEFCCKGRKRNKEGVGEGYGSREGFLFFFYMRDTLPHFTDEWIILCNRKNDKNICLIQIG